MEAEPVMPDQALSGTTYLSAIMQSPRGVILTLESIIHLISLIALNASGGHSKPDHKWARREKTCLRCFRQSEFQTSLPMQARKLKTHQDDTFQKANNKDADQTARMRRLV